MAVSGRNGGFTLVELSVVLMIIGLVTAMAVSTGVSVIEVSRERATQQKLRMIDDALMAFRTVYGRLPCPANLTIAKNAANYGVEAANQGVCTGGTPAANNVAAGITNSGYNGVEGALPVATMGLPSDLMYDGWGSRFRYVVDARYTAADSFRTSPPRCNDGAITVNDANGAARSTSAILAIVSHGANRHGGYTEAGNLFSAGSTNADEQTNCHCDNNGAATTYTPLYVQKSGTLNTSDTKNIFDDLVLYKERWQLLAGTDKLGKCPAIYVADYGNGRVQKFDLKMNYIKSIATADLPDGVAVNSNGELYVVERGSCCSGNQVEKFDSNGTLLATFGTGPDSVNGKLSLPMGITVDGSDNVWVGDTQNNRVQKFDKDGTWLLSIGGPSPHTCQSSPSGTIPACAAGNGDGQFNTELNATLSLAVSPAGKLLTLDSENYRLQTFSLGGVFDSVTAFVCCNGNGEFHYTPSGLAFDSAGNLWIGDPGNSRVQKFSSSYSYLSQFGSNGTGNGQFNWIWAMDVKIDSDDSVWVTDYGNNRVQKFDSSGNFLASYGSHGTGKSQFDGVSGIAIYGP